MIQPGQIYRAADGSGTLIRICDDPAATWWGAPRVDVETVLATGRGVRRRSLITTALHDSPTTKTGQPRRTGYILQPDSAHATTQEAQ